MQKYLLPICVLITFAMPAKSQAQPLAVKDFAQVAKGKKVVLNVLANDNMGTCITSTIAIAIATNPTSGSVAVGVDKKLTYTPNPLFKGRDSFTYTIICGGSSSTATVDLLVSDFPSNFFTTDCNYKPESFEFEMGLKYESTVNVDNYNAMAVGDLDGDGYAEIVAMKYNNGTAHTSGGGSYLTYGFYILNYKAQVVADVNFPMDGTTKYIYSTNSNSITLADLDNDGKGEILFSTAGRADAKNFRLMVYDYNGQFKAQSPISATPFVNTTGVADFENDGYPEIYSGTSIYRYTGSALIELYKGVANVYANAQDIDEDGVPEIVTSSKSYKVSLKTLTGVGSGASANTVTPLATSLFADVTSEALVFALADVDLDGQIEVVAVLPTTTQLTLRIWDPVTGAAKYSVGVSIPNGNLASSFPFIGDSDGDSYPDIAFMGGNSTNTAIYRFGYNKGLNKVEQKGVAGTGFQDYSSRVTGLTMFDFNLDGKMEIVYRDEVNLYILDGTDFSKILTIPNNKSGTLREYPLIASLTPSGESYIIINSSSTKADQIGTVRIYGSTSSPWAPSRKMWNQFAFYQNTMNDNLRVIDYPLPLNFKMSNDTKTIYPFNGHMMQSGPIEINTLEFVHPAPDLSVSGLKYDYNTATDVLTVKITFANTGDASMDAPIPVQSYKVVGGTRTLIQANNFMEDILKGETKVFTYTIASYSSHLPMDRLEVVMADAKVDCTPANNEGEVTVSLKAVRDQVVTDVNTPITIAVLGNDDTNGCNVSLSIATPPLKGSATLSGSSIVYTPASNDIGSGSFTYSITCEGNSATTQVDIATASTVVAEWVSNATEPSTGGRIRFRFREAGATCGNNVRVYFTISGTSMVEGVDYTLSPASFAVIEAGQSQAVLTVIPVNDFVVEESHALTITITSVEIVI